MRAILAIVRREFQAAFVSPIAYAFIAIFLLIVGVGFTTGVYQYATTPALMLEQLGLTLRTSLVAGQYGLATWATFAILLSLPGLSMRLLSEEKKGGTAELLFTSPITTAQIILGKYFGAMSIFALILVLTLPMPAFLALKARPEIAAIGAAYLGLLLYGGVVVAIGLFASSLTENQFIALILTYALTVPLILMELVAPAARPPWDGILASLSIGFALKQASLGVLDSACVALDLVLIVGFLFLSVRVIDSSRWR